MDSPASFPLTRQGSRGANRRPAGAVATHSVRGRLVPVPIRPNSYYTDNGGSATATLSTLAFYQPWGNTLLAVTANNVATGASGMRVFVPFTGTSFGIGLIRDATITANDGLFEVTVDGVVYPIRRNDRQLATLDLTGLGTYSVSDVCGICEDLDDGPHLAILHFPGPVSGETPQTWFIGAWLLDENAGNVQGLRGIQANIANSRTAMPTSAAAITSVVSGSRPPQAVTEVWFHNTDAGAQTVTIRLNSADVRIISIAAGTSAQWIPTVPITPDSGLTWLASSANVFFVIFGAS